MKILITGGSGLIGKALTRRLLAEGYEVNILTRKISNQTPAQEYYWNEKEIDHKAFDSVDVLVHLAGAGIADKRWTVKRKKEIVDSRVKSLQLIAKKYQGNSLKAIVGGSAIGFYGGDTGEIENTELSAHGRDFMAECCKKWEESEEQFADKFNLRIVKIRTGIVLDHKAGALPKIALPIRYGVGSPFGLGRQWMSWIHINDLVEIFYQSIVNPEISGIVNGVAQEPVSNQEFTAKVAKALHRKIVLPNVPSFLLQLALGEMSVVVLGSSKVKSLSPISTSLKFKKLEDALEDLL